MARVLGSGEAVLAETRNRHDTEEGLRADEAACKTGRESGQLPETQRIRKPVIPEPQKEGDLATILTLSRRDFS